MSKTIDNKTRLRISTPNGLFYDSDVYMATVKTTEGYIGLQRNRLPFISNVEISSLYISENPNTPLEKRKCAAIGGGIVFVEKGYIDIFTDDIEWKDQIIKSDVEKQIEIATQKLKEKQLDIIEQHKNELVIKKAMNKLTTLNK